MNLSKLLKVPEDKSKSHKFTSLTFNSKDCKPGSIFFAIKGNKLNGNKFINEAIKNGAKTIISNINFKGFKKNILYINSKNPRSLLAILSKKFFLKKPKNIIAVTGTNGKSSVADFYLQILNLNKKKVSSIGTLGVRSQLIDIKTKNTTLDPITLNRTLYNLYKKKVNNVILEASSHGLSQCRLDGHKFNIGIFTNLSRDHFDYHKNYNNYFNSKLILFKKLLKKKGLIIYDNDIKESKIIKSIIKKNNYKYLSIGKQGSLQIIEHKFVKEKQVVKFKFKNKIYKFKTSLIGKVQIKNLLMALLAATKVVSIRNIVRILSDIKPLQGRFEKIGNINNCAKVFLDYAHTPDALKSCINSLKLQFKMSPTSIVFGCGGDRDKPKRALMGKIASDLCDKVYLTDDNPRNENPKKIRQEIKKFIKKKKLLEIPSRKKAIEKAIKDLKSGNILIVTGKGHENYQEYKTIKKFSDKHFIKKFISIKNSKLSNYWKTNIINEKLKQKKINIKSRIETATINSKFIRKNQIFFGVKGEKTDGSLYVNQAINNNVEAAIINKIKNKNSLGIPVKDSLNFFSEVSKKIREVSNCEAIAITGSSGKTSFKNLLTHVLSRLSTATSSKYSYNNKFGVPLSLFNINLKSNFGVFEVGMDRKGEITKLSKLIRPNLGIITNISYAHIKNFQNLKDIANAKSELIEQIEKGGTIVLNKDDNFFNFLKKKSKNKSLKILTFSKSKQSDIRLGRIKTNNSISQLKIIINGNHPVDFKIPNKLLPYLDNILGVLAIVSVYFSPNEIKNNIFQDFDITDGRGNLIVIKKNNKRIKIIDESYNSNPLSLKFSINNFEKIKSKNSRKIVLLGDMLELGKYSKKLHLEASKYINNSNIDKVFVFGNYIKYTFNKIKPQKRGKILNKYEIKNFIINDLKNDDLLMVKGSNSTGLNNIIKIIKKKNAL